MIVDHVFFFELLCLLGYFMNWQRQRQRILIFTLIWQECEHLITDKYSVFIQFGFFLRRSIVRFGQQLIDYILAAAVISAISESSLLTHSIRSYLSTSGCSMPISWVIEFAIVNSNCLLSFACWLFASFVARLFCFFSSRTLLEDFYCSRIAITSSLGPCGKWKI